MANAILAIANAGATPVLTIGTSALVLPATGVIVEITIPDFSESGGVLTSITTGLNNVAGAGGPFTAAIAIVRTSGGTEVFRGAVGVGSGEVQISSLSIVSGDTVTLTSNLTWTAPP